jgi:hypothetical protein
MDGLAICRSDDDTGNVTVSRVKNVAGDWLGKVRIVGLAMPR